MAKSNHWPYRIIPWQRTVGLAVDLVEQGFLQMGAYPPCPRLDDHQQHSWMGTSKMANACECSRMGEHTIPATDHIVL
jgi:hypothetical protein